MKKVVRLTEADLTRIIRRVLSESESQYPDPIKIINCLSEMNIDIPTSCTGSFFPPQAPNPSKCMKDVLNIVGNNKPQLEKCLGMKLELPSTTPVMNERRYRRR